ncbi:flagellin-like protein [Halobellus sp. MBLA0160]|uniref:Flagellin-like protein n=1 Tax=Halobellus ruber TaxID=2761102 RepID=A0A7J9SKT1_9EURY|nr:flagellin-like protein [Halobellus ruber]MBB6647535.1 flagellin-like protein [Halobellus ruber]
MGLTVLAVGGLTATAGSIVDDGATSAAATRVGADLATALGPAPSQPETTIELTDGTIRVVNRSVWLLEGEEVVWAGHAGAVVYTDGDHRVAGFAGAVVRSDGEGSRLIAPSRIAPADGSLYVGVPVLNVTGADGIATGDRRLAVTLRTDAETARDTLPTGEYRVAVETATPAAWERHFADRGATTERRDIDGDGVPSVVASFDGPRTVHLVVHDVRLDVGVGR